jgi:hypothetical protein
VEVNRGRGVWEIAALDCLYIFGEPVSFALKDGKSAEHKNTGLSVKAGLIKIEDVHWKVADDDF